MSVTRGHREIIDEDDDVDSGDEVDAARSMGPHPKDTTDTGRTATPQHHPAGMVHFAMVRSPYAPT